MQKIIKAIDDKALSDFVLENTGKLKVFIGKENKNNLPVHYDLHKEDYHFYPTQIFNKCGEEMYIYANSNLINDKLNENPNFIGLYFNPIIILYSPSLKGNFNANWYNVFYNIDTWYKVQE